MAPLRLAILEADTPIPPVAAKYGNYTGLFTSLLSAASKERPLSEQVSITGHHIVADLAPDTAPPAAIPPIATPITTSYPALDDIDAILVSGSKHSAYLNEPWIVKLVEFTKACLDSGRIKVIGVCFGHQIVGRALGVTVGVNEKGWEVSVTEVDLTPKGQEIFGLRGGDKLKIHQMHRDIVFSVPPSVESLASNPICATQGFYSPGKLISVQGHPEFTGEIVRELLELRHGMGIFDDAVYGDGIRRVEEGHDGVRIAAAFLRFVRGEL